MAGEFWYSDWETLETHVDGIPKFWFSTLLFQGSEGQKIVVECVLN
jgi:hypothetical protein